MKIKLEEGQTLWFTSDTHYNHSNICKATTTWTHPDDLTRDFKSLEHMNSTIVDNINNNVKENDILIHLGDWSFGGFESIAEFRNRIVCKNIHLILGNHDHHIERNREDIRDLFSSVNHYLELSVNSKKFGFNSFVLMHYPIASWNKMSEGVIHLHGHVHLLNNHRISQGKAMDVGVDGNGLLPISLREILAIMEDQPIKKLSLPVDHHEREIK